MNFVAEPHAIRQSVAHSETHRASKKALEDMGFV